MEVIITIRATEDLLSFDNSLRIYFKKHIDKLINNPIKKHMRFGLPFFVENVTKQARLVYNIDGEELYLLKCFKNHKEYERWYKSYK